jgi:hypothetical protein
VTVFSTSDSDRAGTATSTLEAVNRAVTKPSKSSSAKPEDAEVAGDGLLLREERRPGEGSLEDMTELLHMASTRHASAAVPLC